ncbi:MULTISPECIES: VanZ family protein [Streptomycetaceae]|uniref:Putative integral membrane protein n=1 Tax=Streptantibioticus cattleyicolor (strain ATCC 35852 / DSM 46488 / JCM 4925 / NBRC 14057 / NRRL 8057) TaxID=1003195 RepID=F8K183_STREN|nr:MULTISPECIES: VanZ family protein [Streptomycetaceae]AEW96154.1 putative integral membrane protein [Streptantibioticus cattleyicolor NRRL 8057 = DSM 46488]MYS60681.1 VanZ family protein [Streptomyces sp. SID5468]CCB76492.1 Integral membrane protein [Streptantibioticus cattleyicolor NRRL 8057 = DSM 46488]
MGLALTALHLTVVCWLTTQPASAGWVAAGNFVPFQTIRADLALGGTSALFHLGGGLAMLAPLGVLLPLSGGRVDVPAAVSFARTVFAAMMLSLALAIVRTGPAGQVFDVDTVLLNTVGVAVAHLLVVPAVRARLRRRGRRRPDGGAERAPGAPGGVGQGATPTISRVGVAP